MTTNANGAKTSELRYKPYGEVRYSWGTLPTNRKFTGYAREDGIGGIDHSSRHGIKIRSASRRPDR